MELCKKEISPNVIYDILDDGEEESEELIKKYEKFNLQYFINCNVKDVSCCPTAGCEYFFFYNPETDNKFYCSSCKER